MSVALADSDGQPAESYNEESVPAVEQVDGENGEQKLPDPYANTAAFWLDFASLGLFGAALGAFGFCFLSAYEHFAEWVAEDFFRNDYLDKHTWDFGDGQWAWIGICAGFGLLVGVLRVLLRFPDTYPGFLLEVQHQHADPWLSVRVCVLGLLSLMSGATVGPEAPIGSLGAGMGQLLSDKLGYRWGMQAKYAVLAGMAGGMAVLFPSPLFAVLMLVELGVGTWDPKELWKQVTLTTVCACASFSVYVCTASNGRTYLDADRGVGAAGVAVGWENWYLFAAVPLGIYSAVVGVLALVVYKLSEKVVLRLKQRCAAQFNKDAVTILFPMLFGALSGCINVLCPMSLGDGSLQMKAIFNEGDKIGVGILLASVFAKLVCLGIAQGSGFVGGFFFPMFYVGATAGVLAHLAIEPSTHIDCDNELLSAVIVLNGTGTACIEMTSGDGLNIHFAALTCMAAVPASFVPFPFTITCLVGFMMQLTPYQMTAVYISVTVANTIVLGVGLPQKLLAGAATKDADTHTEKQESTATSVAGKSADQSMGESIAGSSNVAAPGNSQM